MHEDIYFNIEDGDDTDKKDIYIYDGIISFNELVSDEPKYTIDGLDKTYSIELTPTGDAPLNIAPWMAGEEDMETTIENKSYVYTLTGGLVKITKAILVGVRDKDVFIIEHDDGTVDITKHGLGFKPLTDEVFDRVVRREEFRDITYINRDGLVVELHEVDGDTYIKKIPLCVKSKIVNKYNKPRLKVKIQGVSQNLAPFIDAGFGVNNLVDLDIFDQTTLQTHHINGKQSDDRPENLVTLPSFVHYKLHKNSIDRGKELLYDEEAYIGRCIAQLNKTRRDEVLLNLKEFELFCSGIGLTYTHRTKLHKARHMMVKAFDTSDDNHLDVVYGEEFARKVLNLQYQYYKGKNQIEEEEQEDVGIESIY